MLITCPHCSRSSEHIAEVRRGDLVVDLERSRVRRGLLSLGLAPLELRVLVALIQAENGLTRREIEAAAWLDAPATSENSAPNTVMRLRAKLSRFRADIPKLAPNVEYRYRLVVAP